MTEQQADRVILLLQQLLAESALPRLAREHFDAASSRPDALPAARAALDAALAVVWRPGGPP